VNTQPAKYGRLVDKDGTWKSRSDVKFWWNRGGNIVKGDLNVGQGSSATRIGPEYAVGQIMGDHFEEPVLIIKTAWGGKSLSIDFRPPTAVRKRGGKVGFYYNEMLNNIHQVLDNFSTEYPEYAGQGYDIVGFGWHQGYNDGLSDFTATEYKENLPDFIADIRTEIGKPSLPFALASTGHGGASQKGSWLKLTNSQLAILDSKQFPQLKGNVSATDTRPFWRDTSISPTNQGHHWNHHAKTYYEIGEAIGNGLKALMK
jgi:alpha-galactosidase